MKEIKLLFYKTNPSETNIGLKHVLWAITDIEDAVTHDWGFGFWDGNKWDDMPVPEGYKCSVEYWANTVNPDLLVNESKIIRI